MRLLLYRYFILILVTMLKVKEKREKSSPPRPSLRRCDSTRLHSTRRDATYGGGLVLFWQNQQQRCCFSQRSQLH